jgi:hypothetical protein
MRASSSLVGVVAAIALATGCAARAEGSFDDDDDRPDADPGIFDEPDARPLPDGAPAVAPDNACGVAASLGDLGALTATAQLATQGQSSLRIYSLGAPTPATAQTATPDVVYIELWDNYGAFANTVAQPGTYVIAGPELSYATCGVCVFALADVTDMAGPARILQATAGTVTVHAVAAAPGAPLAVEVQGVQFQEVDPAMFQPVQGSTCTSPLAHGRLDGVVP